MSRSAAVVVLALSLLLSTASIGCSAPAAASRESSSLKDVARGASFLVEPGSLDVQNVHLPAVLIFAHIVDEGSGLTRARELRGAAITEIFDKRSSCAQTASVSTLVYGLGTDGGRPTVKPADYYGSVLIHPGIELIAGKRGRLRPQRESECPAGCHHHGRANAGRDPNDSLHQHLPAPALVVGHHPAGRPCYGCRMDPFAALGAARLVSRPT